MFDHVVFGVSDYAASRAFFLKALEPLGVAVVSEGPLGGRRKSVRRPWRTVARSPREKGRSRPPEHRLVGLAAYPTGSTSSSWPGRSGCGSARATRDTPT